MVSIEEPAGSYGMRIYMVNPCYLSHSGDACMDAMVRAPARVHEGGTARVF
jgi:hypothetical protein